MPKVIGNPQAAVDKKILNIQTFEFVPDKPDMLIVLESGVALCFEGNFKVKVLEKGVVLDER